MNKIILLAFLICIVFSGCSTDQKGKNIEKSSRVITENTDNNPAIITPSDSGIVKIDLIDGKNSTQIRKKENQTIYLEFSSDGYKNLFAHLSSSDTLANIRFSQILLPNGTMDGPFGRDMEYQLPINGIYKISIHENMMAGDPWQGVFNVDITLKK